MPNNTPGAPNERLDTLVPAKLESALEAVEETCRLWGGDWRRSGTGGTVELPVAAGIRRGFVNGEISTAVEGDKTRIHLSVTKEQYKLQNREVVVLFIGAVCGLFLVVVPFLPHLFDLIPMAGLLVLLAWFLVVSRLRNKSPGEFLEEIGEVAMAMREGEEGSEGAGKSAGEG